MQYRVEDCSQQLEVHDKVKKMDGEIEGVVFEAKETETTVENMVEDHLWRWGQIEGRGREGEEVTPRENCGHSSCIMHEKNDTVQWSPLCLPTSPHSPHTITHHPSPPLTTHYHTSPLPTTHHTLSHITPPHHSPHTITHHPSPPLTTHYHLSPLFTTHSHITPPHHSLHYSK